MEHFNLTIHPGEKLAIVGNNGAGKTTLIKIICGLYRPTSGKLLINGLDTATLSPEEIYLWCTAVFQDFHLLAATLAENVSCMPEEKTDDRRVRSCLKQVGLAQKIESLPKGLHTQMTKELEQDGVLLSGGELQKLMIARCLYTDRPILILDEPTSSLDAVAESQIYQNYYELTKEKTSIFIFHRLSSTKFCDRIIHLQNGKIIEEGTNGIQARRKAEAEDKTMLDVWLPVTEALKNNQLTADVIENAKEHTKNLVAKKGRASYLGERAIGHIDPGAASSAILFQTLLDVIHG